MKKERWGLVLLLCVLLSLFEGCITTEKVNRFIDGNQPYRDSLIENILLANKCDTVKIYKSDTTFQHDTTIVTCTDTIGKYIHDTTTKTITLKWFIRDTAIVIDRRTVDALAIQLTNANNTINSLKLTNSEEQLKTKVAVDNTSSWMWKAIITWILIVIAFLIWLYLEFKPKIKL